MFLRKVAINVVRDVTGAAPDVVDEQGYCEYFQVVFVLDSLRSTVVLVQEEYRRSEQEDTREHPRSLFKSKEERVLRYRANGAVDLGAEYEDETKVRHEGHALSLVQMRVHDPKGVRDQPDPGELPNGCQEPEEIGWGG